MILFRLKRYITITITNYAIRNIKTIKTIKILNLLDQFYQKKDYFPDSKVVQCIKNNELKEGVHIIPNQSLKYIAYNKTANIELSEFNYNPGISIPCIELKIIKGPSATTISARKNGECCIKKTYNEPYFRHDELAQINALETLFTN